MKFWIPIFLFVCLPANAATRYVSQSGGLFTDGTACNGQTAISVVTFNTTSQSAGDINWLCGTITSALTPSGSGSTGNVISILFDTGSKLSFSAVPTSGAIVLTGLSFYLVDGGGGSCGWTATGGNNTCSQGKILSTANGTGLANQIASVAIFAQNASNIEIRGLLIGPLYNHTSTSDLVLSPPGAVCVLFQGGSHFNIHNNTLHDMSWCIDGGSATGVVTISNNEFYNVDHGLGMGGPNNAVTVHDNHFHDFANWDTTNNSFHHDGIHFFGSTGNTVTNSIEYNNLFDGDPGANWTADIYNEGLDTGFLMYNNVAIVSVPNRQSCCGIINFYGNGFQGANNSAYNNTIYGAYVAGSGGCFGVQSQTNVLVENTVGINCNGIMDVDAASTINVIDFNAWDDVGTSQGIDGSANTFSWHGSQFSSFTTWKTDCSCDSHSVFQSVSNMKMSGSNGRQLSGSPLIGAGTNLTSLSITSLDSDILGNSRPGGVTAWDIGAYFGAQAASTASSPAWILLP